MHSRAWSTGIKQSYHPYYTIIPYYNVPYHTVIYHTTTSPCSARDRSASDCSFNPGGGYQTHPNQILTDAIKAVEQPWETLHILVGLNGNLIGGQKPKSIKRLSLNSLAILGILGSHCSNTRSKCHVQTEAHTQDTYTTRR